MVRDLSSRGVGLLLIGIAAALFWFIAWQPLAKAAATGADFEVPAKLFMAAPMATVCGLFLLIGGAPVGEAFAGPPRERRHKRLVWVVFLLSMAASAGTLWWFDGRLAALGYDTLF